LQKEVFNALLKQNKSVVDKDAKLKKTAKKPISEKKQLKGSLKTYMNKVKRDSLSKPKPKQETVSGLPSFAPNTFKR